MKNFLTLALLILALLTVRCKKVNTAPATSTTSTDGYDAANNIFRVKVSSSNVAYTVTIKRSNAANPGGDLQVANQSTGSPFESPFTPAIGDSIKVVAQSTKGAVYLYALYKGAQLSPIVNQNNPNGGTTSSFSYLVKN
ncbi:MAG: hypothetical protein JWR67_1947 [Mucilaginibacter sp.]|nr:hypothetical protein [Mucilaginibacter sp.]